MAAMSNYLENKLIDHIFRTSSYTKPTVVAIALCTAAPDDTSTGATITEVSGGSYARQALNPLDTNWRSTNGSTSGDSSGTGGTTDNASTITFPTATGSWGTITHVAIVDSTSAGAGNVLFWGALTVSKTVTSGDVFTYQANQLQIQIDS